MWEHYCKVEHATIGVGDGEECNWCGETEEDHQMITIDEVTENEDGSADLNITITDETSRQLIAEGFKEFAEEAKEKIVVLPVKEGQFSKNVKQYELSDEEAQLLLQMGFVRALKAGLDIAHDTM